MQDPHFRFLFPGLLYSFLQKSSIFKNQNIRPLSQNKKPKIQKLKIPFQN